MMTAATLLVALAIGFASLGPGDSERGAQPRPATCEGAHDKRCLRAAVVADRPFGPDSVWADRLADGARLSPMSDAYVQRLEEAVDRHGSWVNTTEWSAPVYTVGEDQRTVTVTLDKPPDVNLALRRALERVPIPPGAEPAGDSDAHLVVWQPATDTMWELWGARRADDGWHARYGGRMTDVSHSRGYFPSPPTWGATATGLPLLGGLIRISELRAGVIPHALALELPEPRDRWYAWPAQRTDGASTDPEAIPEGTRFRLDPSLDLSKLELPRFVRLAARAAQRYGIYVTDRGGTVALQAEDPAPRRSNPYWPDPEGFFEGQDPAKLLERFPWSALEVVKAPISCCGR